MPLERRTALLQASADLRLFLLCDEVYHLLSFEEDSAFQAKYPDGVPPPFACLASMDATAKTSGSSGGGGGGGGENKCNDDIGDAASVTNRGDGDGDGDVEACADADTGADTDDADADDDVLFGALAGPDLVLGLAAFTKVGLVAHVYIYVSMRVLKALFNTHEYGKLQWMSLRVQRSQEALFPVRAYAPRFASTGG